MNYRYPEFSSLAAGQCGSEIKPNAPVRFTHAFPGKLKNILVATGIQGQQS